METLMMMEFATVLKLWVAKTTLLVIMMLLLPMPVPASLTTPLGFAADHALRIPMAMAYVTPKTIAPTRLHVITRTQRMKHVRVSLALVAQSTQHAIMMLMQRSAWTPAFTQPIVIRAVAQ